MKNCHTQVICLFFFFYYLQHSYIYHYSWWCCCLFFFFSPFFFDNFTIQNCSFYFKLQPHRLIFIYPLLYKQYIAEILVVAEFMTIFLVLCQINLFFISIGLFLNFVLILFLLLSSYQYFNIKVTIFIYLFIILFFLFIGSHAITLFSYTYWKSPSVVV